MKRNLALASLATSIIALTVLFMPASLAQRDRESVKAMAAAKENKPGPSKLSELGLTERDPFSTLFAKSSAGQNQTPGMIVGWSARVNRSEVTTNEQ